MSHIASLAAVSWDELQGAQIFPSLNIVASMFGQRGLGTSSSIASRSQMLILGNATMALVSELKI